MADSREGAEAAREAARRAREGAERLRHEADRLRSEKRTEASQLRSEALRLRHEAREMDRRARNEDRTKSRGRAHHEELHRIVKGLAGAAGESESPGSGATASETFSAIGLAELHIHQTAGKLSVVACGPGEEPSVRASGSRSAPQLDVKRDGGRVRIEITLSTGWLFRRRQGATTVLKLPTDLGKVDIDLGYGEVQARDFASGVVKIHVGAGEIATYSLGGALEADVGAGKVAVHDHSGTVRCNSGTGDAVVDVAQAAFGDYRMEVGMGRAELRFPPGEIVTIRASSGIGKKRIDYPQGPEDAPIRIAVETGIGEAIVKARVAGKAPERPRDPIKPQRAGRAGAPLVPRRREAEELRVLEMLEQGKITSQEAAELIAALQGSARPPDMEDEDEGPRIELRNTTPD